jgi:hypothetical protein
MFTRPLTACRMLLATGILLVLAGELRAAGGPVVVFPQPGTKIKSGLLMTLDFRGVDANGYRPVRVEFKTLTGAPLTADRQVRVEIWPRYYGASTPEVTKIVELPEGSTVVTDTIIIPQSAQWYNCRLEVFEDGDKLEDLSSPGIGWTGVNYWDWSEARPVILVIDGNVPDRAARDSMISDFKRGIDPKTQLLPEVRGLTNLFPDPNRGGTFFTNQTTSDANLLSTLADQFPRLELLPPAELPENWIELSQFDMAIIPLADLKALAASEPGRFRALSQWASGGPLLLVTGVGNDFAGLAQIDRLLNLPPLPVDPDRPGFSGWQPADNEDHVDALRSDLEDAEDSMRAVRSPYGQAFVRPNNQPRRNFTLDDKPLKAPDQVPFAQRPMGLGVIVGIAKEKPFPGEEADWKWIFNSVPRNHWMWYQRHGFSLHRTNDDYWDFLIPGVGEAPVVSFLLLVSLFAVLIGPVNYMLLGRAQRLYLLLITVPLGAVLVTGSLFTYALLTDGLGVKLRARSFTDLDQRTGRAVAWSRQSYYAAIAPSKGLSFPTDSTVFPIQHRPTGMRHHESPTNYLTWGDEDQNLTDGYLTSRTATQFMVLRITQSPDKLAVREGSAAGQPPQVTNQLKTDLHLVVLRDSRGELWRAEKLAADKAQATLRQTTEIEAADVLRKLYAANPPEEPRGYDPQLHNNALSLFMPNYSFYSVDNSSSLPVMASSMLEKNLALATDPAQGLSPGTYVAVVELSPVVPYGVPRVREEASLHMIRGRY